MGDFVNIGYFIERLKVAEEINSEYATVGVKELSAVVEFLNNMIDDGK